MAASTGSAPTRLLCLFAASVVASAARAGVYTCPSFRGAVCAGHGTCVNSTAGAQCECETGFKRSDCSYADYCVGDCGGPTRGVCVQPATKNADPLQPGVCKCHAGFAGASCTLSLLPMDGSGVGPSGCEAFCSGHGRADRSPSQHVAIQKRVRVFDASGHT